MYDFDISMGVFGRVRTTLYRGYLLGKYHTEVLGKVRHGLDSLPNIAVRFGTTSIPVPTSVSSVRPQCRYPTLTSVSVYDLNTDMYDLNTDMHDLNTDMYDLNTC